MNKYSSCCGVEMNDAYAGMLICPDCKEHCSIETICGNCGEIVNKVNSEGWCRDCDELEVDGQIYG